jgi:hypothetical protein
MLTKINSNGFEIYTNQIIHPEEFLKLSKKEKILTSFKTKVNDVKDKAFATFLADKRHNLKIKEGELIILRAIKDKRKFEFISKVGKWGRFHILKETIEVLGIQNHELIDFEVIRLIGTTNTLPIKEVIDLINIPNSKVIHRENDFITLTKLGAIPITLPRFIKITPKLIELFYLIHGDGSYQEKLYFVNKDSGLHHFVLDNFEEIFRIPRETWRVRLLFNHDSDAEIAKSKWKEVLNLKKEQFYPSISKCTLNTSEFGNLRIVIDKRIVAILFRYAFETLQNPSGKNALHALNGLLCAEGSAEKTKESGLHKITISYSSKEKEMFLKILAEVGLSDAIKDREDRFVIEGWTNCYKFFKVFFSNNIVPFNLHKGRCNNALSGFLEHSFTKSMDKYLSILNKKESMDTNEIVGETRHLGNSVRKILRKKQYLPFVRAEGRGVNRKPIRFSITPEGKEFLTLTKDIREVYNKKWT